MKNDFNDFSNEYGKQIVLIPISSEFEYNNYEKNIGKSLNVRFLSWNKNCDFSLVFKPITQIKYLDLRNLGLEFLPPEIGLCQNLERLDIRDNCLVYLPPELSKCLKLKNLLYSGNNLFYVSPIQAMNFLRQMYQAEGFAPEYKLPQTNSFFTLISWNIIAQFNSNQKNFPLCPDKYLQWSYRVEQIIRVIIQIKPTLICLQELEENQLNILIEKMRTIGYGCSYAFSSRPRTPTTKPIGVATFYLKSRLTFDRAINYSFSDLPADQNINKLQLISNESVFQICSFRLHSQSFYIINTSLIKNHFEPNVLLAQTNIIANKADELIGQVLFCGSFSFEPNSEPYNLLKYGEINNKFFIKKKFKNVYEDQPDFFTFWDEENNFKTTDFIWTSSQLVPNCVLSYTKKSEVLSFHHTSPNNQWPSNHFPIGTSIDMRIQNIDQ